MHVDEFIARNEPAWRRLRELSGRGRRGVRRLSADELDELVRLYQRVSAHLSLARTRYRDPALTASLSRLVAQAASVVYGTRTRTLRAAGRFFADTFPAAVWHARWFVLASTLLFLVPAIAIGTWMATSPAALEAAAPEAVRQAYVEEDFESYYTDLASAQFAATVTTNNIRVGVLAFAGGVLACVPTVYVIVLNGANLGFAAGLFGAVGELGRFFGLIVPHGLLELSAVFIAGAAGLRLGWTLIDPGDRRRGRALVEEGRRAIVIVIGLVVVFIVAGLIEGFVTGAPWPTEVRVGIGVAAQAAFTLYLLTRGRAAARRGLTGAMGEQSEAGWARPDHSAPYSRPVAFARR